jgi:hypothetical protein
VLRNLRFVKNAEFISEFVDRGAFGEGGSGDASSFGRDFTDGF